MKLNEITEEEFIEKIGKQTPLTDSLKVRLKEFYKIQGERNILLAIKQAVRYVQSMITDEFTVIGFQTTRLGKQYYICLRESNNDICSVSANSPFDQRDVLTIDGQMTSRSIMIPHNINKKPEKGEIKFTPMDVDNISAKSRGMLYLNGFSNVIASPAIDWAHYDRNSGIEISEAPKLDVLTNGAINISLSFMFDDLIVNTYFNGVPMKFFDELVTENLLNDLEAFSESLIDAPLVIPSYISKVPTATPNAEGKILTNVKATAFGMLYHEEKVKTESKKEEVGDVFGESN